MKFIIIIPPSDVYVGYGYNRVDEELETILAILEHCE